MTIHPRSPRGRRCPIRPRSPMPAPSSRIPPRGRRRRPRRARRSRQRKLQARRCRLCARAFRTDRAAQGLARRRDRTWREMPATRSSISAPISKARRATSPPSTRGWRCRRARRQARGDPVRRRTHRDRARQWPRRTQPGICAGAGRPAQGHAGHFGAGRPIPTAPTAARAVPPIPPAPSSIRPRLRR